MKNKTKLKPEEALEFLESMRKLSSNIDEERKLISIRIPQNLLRALKLKAKNENKKYQSMIIESIRDFLKD